jgi:flagellar basal body rod protein FlgB
MSAVTDRVGQVLADALRGLAAREGAIASNVANVDTPGYVPRAVPFEAVLQREIASDPVLSGAVLRARSSTGVGGGGLSGANPPPADAAARLPMRPPETGPSAAVALRTATPGATPGAVVGSAGDGRFTPVAVPASGRNDGNAVDVEAEMTALATTQLQYGAVARLLSVRYQNLRTAIGGR